jgi:hypothetical protein
MKTLVWLTAKAVIKLMRVKTYEYSQAAIQEPALRPVYHAYERATQELQDQLADFERDHQRLHSPQCRGAVERW